MNTFKLTIAALAIATVASGAASAASFDSNGNIPNHGGDKIISYTDSADTYNNDWAVTRHSTLSPSDEDVLQFDTNRDQISKH